MQYYWTMRELLIKLPRNIKRLILIIADIFVIFLVFWISLMIRSGDPFWPNETYALTNASPEHFLMTTSILIAITIPIFIYMRLYRSIIRYISLETYVKIVKSTALASFLTALIINYYHFPVPKSSLLIYFVLLTGAMYLTRFIAKSYLLNSRFDNQRNILIYGINDSSQKVSDILRNTNDFNISGFISSDKKLYNGQVGAGLSASHGQGWGYKEIGKIKILALCVNNAVGVVYEDNKPIHNPGGDKNYSLDNIQLNKNTTIIVVMTNLELDNDELSQMNNQINVSIGESIRPFNTLTDGDILYTCSTQEIKNKYSTIQKIKLFDVYSEVLKEAILNSVK